MDTIKRLEVEQAEKWLEWLDKIPPIRFPRGWQVQVIPPFHGAAVRFRVKKGEKYISVYLDTYNRLGYMDGPYWEVYPVDGDVERCYMNEVEELVKIISKALRQLK